MYFASRNGRLSVGAQVGEAAGTMVFFLVAMFVLFIEGMICIVLVLPVFMIASIIGGLIMGLALRWACRARCRRRWTAQASER